MKCGETDRGSRIRQLDALRSIAQPLSAYFGQRQLLQHVPASAAGDKPVQALKQAGIRVGIVEGLIERSLEIIYGGGDLDLYAVRGRCGGCAGGAKGCM